MTLFASLSRRGFGTRIDFRAKAKKDKGYGDENEWKPLKQIQSPTGHRKERRESWG